MNVKRFLTLGILGIFLVSLMGGVLAEVSAEEASERVVGVIGGFLTPLLGPLFGEKEMATRTFFAMLLGMIIYSIISIMFNKSSRWITWGITGAITSLALLGLPSGFLEVIRIQYGAMGATILTIIPFFIIMAFTLQINNLLAAKVTWIFYAMYYLAMYSYEVVVSDSFSSGLPYGTAFFVGIAIFFGIGEIRNLIFKGQIEGIIEKGHQRIAKRKALQNLEDKDFSSRYNS
jgi:hypothetical protein